MTRFRAGSWSGLNAVMDNISIATASRYLSVTAIPDQSSLHVCLFHEDDSGQVNAQRGSWQQVESSGFSPTSSTSLDVSEIPSTSSLTYIASSRSTLTAFLADPVIAGPIIQIENITISFSWKWQNITERLRASMSGNNFSAPFSSAAVDNGCQAIFSGFINQSTYRLNTYATTYVNGTFESCMYLLYSPSRERF